MAKKFVKREISPEVVSTFLEGHDPQKGIVNLEYNYKDDYIKVFYRDEDDIKHVSSEPFYPFLWATSNACRKMCNCNRNEFIALTSRYGIRWRELDTTNSDGEVVESMKNGYMWLFYATKPMSYSKFLEFFRVAGNPVYSYKSKKEGKESFTDQPIAKKDDRQYLTVTPQEQFLISTGKRFFKGYEDYDQTLRLIFDWETTGLDVEKDRIEKFGIHFNRPVRYNGEYINFETIYNTVGETEEEKDASELYNIDQFLRIIYTFRPDIVTAHNGEAFDFSILIGACKRLGTTLEDMSKKYFNGRGIVKSQRETILKLGGEIEKYYQTIIPGCIVTDSLHAVRRAQALDSNMLSSNLKYVTKYSKIVKPDRVYVPGDMISKIGNDETFRYALNEKDGDWYIYDPDYVMKEIKPDPLKDLDYFRRALEADRYLKTVSGDTHGTYNNSITAEELYDEYISTIKRENEESVYKKGKSGDKFTLYTKNVLLDGYKLTMGSEIIRRYLLDDLWECDKVEHRYNTSNFLICKMLPVPFQKCCTMGTAGQWKALMLAWSYENNLAIPSFGESKTFTGGLARLLRVGFVANVAKFDYNSLYPSIILTWAISDEKDLMGTMLAFLEYVLTQREKYKKLKKVASKNAEAVKTKLASENLSVDEKEKLSAELLKWKAEESANDKKQLPLKIFGNSFFGSYGAPNVFPWASVDCAERTTCIGRMCLRLMIYWFSEIGKYKAQGSEADNLSDEDIVFIKYDDTKEIERRAVSDLTDGRVSRPYKILTEDGWVFNGQRESLTRCDKETLISFEKTV